MQLAGDFQQRLRGVIERHQLSLQRIQRLDLRARRLAREDPFLDLFDLSGQGVDDGEVAIDHVVHQRIENVRGTMLQQLRLLFAASPNIRKPELRGTPHRHDVLRSDED